MPIRFPSGEIAVNDAATEALCALPGVGMAQAEAIIAEREANGRFVFPQDLLAVKGIGEKKLAGLLEQIRLE